MAPKELHVLFVCTANISRSPYAERRARMMLGAAPVSVASAGIPGYPCRSMDPAMAEQLELRGGDGQGHLSRVVDDEVLDGTDLVLTFEFAQHMRLLERWPGLGDRVLGLQQFAEAVEELTEVAAGGGLVRQVAAAARMNSMTGDVADPYGRGKGTAKRVARQIDDLLVRVIPALSGAPRHALLEPLDRATPFRAPRRLFR